MTIPGSANPLLMRSAAPTAYQVERSLRFNSSDSGFCSRTPTSAGNRKKFTLSFWLKRSKLGTTQNIFDAGDANLNPTDQNFRFRLASEVFEVILGGGASSVAGRFTGVVYRDCSAWYHIVLAVDTDQAAIGNAFVLYVNGVQTVTATSFGSVAYSSGISTAVNNTVAHNIGRSTNASAYIDGYLADIHFIDGQALTPSSFTEVSATTGQLIPKAYTGTFGTNGFWLKFSDNSNNTAATLGKDYSPNGNNWTPNNLSVTAGAGNDSLVDTPTSYGTDTGAGGEVRGNYCTLNPLANAGLTLSNGNLDFTSDSGNIDTCISTFAVSSGKWYWELNVTDFRIAIGIEPQGYYPAAGARTGFDSTGYAWWIDRQEKYHNGSSAAYGASTTTGDIIGVALDLDAGTLVFYKNNVSQGTAYSGITGTYLPAICDCSTAGAATGSFNFGQRPFAYTAPSGFKALCDTNLPAPVVAKPNTVMDVKLYTGNGGTQTISGLGFSPDLVWGKLRSTSSYHRLHDSVRGSDNTLASNVTDAEVVGNGIVSFTSDGWEMDANTNINQVYPYVAWTWDAGSSTVTNTQGSITSSVRANTSAGFSVVTYTGNGSSGATVGHGLGVAPAFFVVKRRNAADSWLVYHSFTGNTKYLLLNNTTAAATYSGAWNDAGPSSTTITLGNDVGVNANGGTYVCYAWAPLSGYSSFGSYTGNGSADGPFVYTGFRPRWIMVKCTQDIAGDVEQWVIKDTTRSTYNEAFDNLYANLSNAEDDAAGSAIDMLSNGFKLRGTYGGINGSATYIYAAFAENPFQYARAR